MTAFKEIDVPTPLRTKSELLFEEVCAQHGVICTRLPERTDGPQPDYEVTVGGQRVAVEIKQVEANETDRQFADALARDGHAFERRNLDDIAERVRDDIDDSRRQLRAYLERQTGTPAILVIFDCTNNGYDDPNVIRTAMFGWEHVLFARTATGPVVTDRGFAPRNNSEIRHDKNCHLSALVTLHEGTDFKTRERHLGLCFYHNHYANVPFSSAWWKGDRISHLRLTEKLPGNYQDFAPLA